MANQIVTVNVSIQTPPKPPTLQATGALISQGGTNLTPGVLDPNSPAALLTQKSDLTAIIIPPAAITSLTWSGSVVTVTTTAPHGIPNADIVPVIIAGAAPVGYNGHFLATSTGASTFTFPLVSDPGSETTPGTWQPGASNALQAMVNTFFGQGNQQSIFVLELGFGSAAQGVTALGTFITNNPGVIYSYLVPRSWSAESTYFTFLAQFNSPTAKTYFFSTATTGNYTSYTALTKCAFVMIEAPAVASAAAAGTDTEFSCAAPFFWSLFFRPSPTNKVAPFSYIFLYGVTPYPISGNGPTLTQFKAASVNYVGTAAEGGLSNTILLFGNMKDGNPFTYWYSVDWIQINIDINEANAIINGSNNPINPLYYDQPGIDRLLQVAVSTVKSAVSFGLALFPPVSSELDGQTLAQQLDDDAFVGVTVVNAIPFLAYVATNPDDYPVGEYGGLSIDLYTPNRGFIHLTFNIQVTNFIAT